MRSRFRNGFMIQDISMLFFLVSIIAAAFMVCFSNADLRMENIILFLVLMFCVVLASFQLSTLAITCAGLQVLIFTAYKLFFSYSQGVTVPVLSYVWLVLPLFAVGSMIVFSQGRITTELENNLLKQQVEELVMIDALTGLYNIRSMYNDLERQIAYAHRTNMIFTLMIIKLRYEAELKKILNSKNYDALRQRLASIIEDNIRLEDRIYAFDDKGSVALILTCDSNGAAIIRQRIINAVNDKNAFDNITDAPIKVEIKNAYLQYTPEDNKLSAMEYVQKVESELQYDV